jgi:hypothetical protein
MSFDLENEIRKTRQVEAKIKEIEELQKQALEPYKKVAEGLRNRIQEYMIANKQLSAKTDAGQAVIAKKTSYRVEDQQEFKNHVIGHAEWDMIVWAVKRSAAEAFQDATNTLPPGVVKSTVLELRLLAPEKKRVRKPASVSDEGSETFDPFVDEEPADAQ